MREPKNAPPAVQPQPQETIITQVREYRLITPLFGGGVTPGECDPLTPIRGTAIRGHLRFWWRACRGGKFNGNLEAMKKEEDAIWGAAANAQNKDKDKDKDKDEKNPPPPPVQVAVPSYKPGTELTVEHKGNKINVGDPRSSYGYVAFPLRDSGGKVVENIEFRLTISFHKDHCEDVKAALWAWETFGGIGARTRRGFGALQCTSITENGQSQTLIPLPDTKMEVKAWVTKYLDHVVSGDWPGDVPHLSKSLSFELTDPMRSPNDAWKELIRKLKNFRQQRHPGSAHNRPGRSKWPEPDAIRRLTRSHCHKHAEELLTVDKFPRAAFGLPIIFHFKDRGDPDDTTLEGENSKRLASPLILRPLACASGKGIGIALILETPDYLLPDDLVLKGNRKTWRGQQATLTQQEARAIEPLNGKTAVLQAFLDTLK